MADPKINEEAERERFEARAKAEGWQHHGISFRAGVEVGWFARARDTATQATEVMNIREFGVMDRFVDEAGPAVAQGEAVAPLTRTQRDAIMFALKKLYADKIAKWERLGEDERVIDLKASAFECEALLSEILDGMMTATPASAIAVTPVAVEPIPMGEGEARDTARLAMLEVPFTVEWGKRAAELADEARREADAIRGDFESTHKLIALIDSLAALANRQAAEGAGGGK